MSTLNFASVSTDPGNPGVALAKPAHSRLRQTMRLVTIAWIFGALWQWSTNGVVTNRFAKALHTPDYAFGIISAIPFVCTIFQLPAIAFQHRYGRRKSLFLWTMTISRMSWVLIAAIPWIFPHYDRGWWLLIVLLLLTNATGAAPGPAWMSWMADEIPRRIRGRYFGFRNRLGQFVGISATLVAGFVMDVGERRELLAPGSVLMMGSILLAVAGLIGTLDIQLFNIVPDPHPHRTDDRGDVWASFFAPLANANFRRFLLFNFLLTLAIGFVGTYNWVYTRDVVHMSNQQANFLIAAVPMAGGLLSYPLWARLLDRMGRKPVLIVAGGFIISGSVGWILVGPDVTAGPSWGECFAALGHGHLLPIIKTLTGWHWAWRSWIGYGLIMVTTLGWPGVDMANLNMVLDMAETRGGTNRNATAYVALYNIAVAIGGTFSGLLGGAVAGMLTEKWSWAVPLLGITLTYHGVLFILSTVIRIGAVSVAVRLEEPHARHPREVVAYMTDQFYANMREVMLIPNWVVGQAYRWTNRLGRTFNREDEDRHE